MPLTLITNVPILSIAEISCVIQCHPHESPTQRFAASRTKLGRGLRSEVSDAYLDSYLFAENSQSPAHLAWPWT